MKTRVSLKYFVNDCSLYNSDSSEVIPQTCHALSHLVEKSEISLAVVILLALFSLTFRTSESLGDVGHKFDNGIRALPRAVCILS